MSWVLFSDIAYTMPFIIVAVVCIIIGKKIGQSENTVAKETATPIEPNLKELEQKLDELLKNNTLAQSTHTLQQQLDQTPSNTIAAYMSVNKKQLNGFHLFQLIFSLIRNRAEDGKIIRLMRHYFPSSSTAHLYAMLRSFKEFLNITTKDNVKKELMSDLNRNHIKTTLIYLEKKLNQTLNRVPTVPPALQQPLIEEAVTYGLIFAAFCEFYNREATAKILRLAAVLAPELFKYWHTAPQTSDWQKTSLHKRQISPKKYLSH